MEAYWLGSVGLVYDYDVSSPEVDAAGVEGALVTHAVRVCYAHPQICMKSFRNQLCFQAVCTILTPCTKPAWSLVPVRCASAMRMQKRRTETSRGGVLDMAYICGHFTLARLCCWHRHRLAASMGRHEDCHRKARHARVECSSCT